MAKVANFRRTAKFHLAFFDVLPDGVVDEPGFVRLRIDDGFQVIIKAKQHPDDG